MSSDAKPDPDSAQGSEVRSHHAKEGDQDDRDEAGHPDRSLSGSHGRQGDHPEAHAAGREAEPRERGVDVYGRGDEPRHGVVYDPTGDPNAQPLTGLEALETQGFSYSHSGPLPDAAQLAHYEQILPGLADRIVTMAEDDMASRQADRRSLVQAEAHATVAATWMLGLLPYALAVMAAWFAWQGLDAVAAIAAIGAVAALLPRLMEAWRGKPADNSGGTAQAHDQDAEEQA